MRVLFSIRIQISLTFILYFPFRICQGAYSLSSNFMNDCLIDSIQSTISCCIRSCIFDLHTGLVAHTYVKLTIVLFNKTCVQKTVAEFLNECALCFLLTLSLCFVMFCSHKPRYDKYSFNDRLPSLSNGILCFNFDNSIRRILIVYVAFLYRTKGILNFTES